MPLIYMRLSGGIRLRFGGSDRDGDPTRGHQFGIRQVLWATAAIAVLLAIARATLGLLERESGARGGDDLVIATILLACSTVTSWVVICYSLAVIRLVAWRFPICLFCVTTGCLGFRAYEWNFGSGTTEVEHF